MILIISLLITCLISIPAYAAPLQGYVSNPPTLCLQRPKLDRHGKPLIGHVKHSSSRGLIGVLFNRSTGEIVYIYPESDLRHYGVRVGDYIVGIEKELYRPCLMPGVVIYPSGFILNLTIRTTGGKIKTVPVKLIDARKFTGG